MTLLKPVSNQTVAERAQRVMAEITYPNLF